MLYSFLVHGCRINYIMSRYRSSFFWYSGWWMVVLFLDASGPCLVTALRWFRTRWTRRVANCCNLHHAYFIYIYTHTYTHTYTYTYICVCPNIKANQKEVKATWCMAKGSMHLRHCLWVGFTSKSLNWQTQTCLRLKLKPNNFSPEMQNAEHLTLTQTSD